MEGNQVGSNFGRRVLGPFLSGVPFLSSYVVRPEGLHSVSDQVTLLTSVTPGSFLESLPRPRHVSLG